MKRRANMTISLNDQDLVLLQKAKKRGASNIDIFREGLSLVSSGTGVYIHKDK